MPPKKLVGIKTNKESSCKEVKTILFPLLTKLFGIEFCELNSIINAYSSKNGGSEVFFIWADDLQDDKLLLAFLKIASWRNQRVLIAGYSSPSAFFRSPERSWILALRSVEYIQLPCKLNIILEKLKVFEGQEPSPSPCISLNLEDTFPEYLLNPKKCIEKLLHDNKEENGNDLTPENKKKIGCATKLLVKFKLQPSAPRNLPICC